MATIAPQRISIALCTYNGAAFLASQLDSFRAQSRLPDELVVCDDGSLDDTLHILERFAAEANFPVHIFRNPVRLGSTANFSQAIGLCTGEIIVLSDQDDVWRSTKLAQIESAFTATPNTGGVFSNGILIDDHGQELRGNLWSRVGFNKHQQAAVRKNQAFDMLFRGNFATGATMAFRKNMTSVLLPIPAGWVHDYWIASLLAATSQLDFIDAPLIEYRCHTSQQLGIQNGMWESWHRFLASNNITFQLAAARWIEIRDRLRQHGNPLNSSSLSKCEVLIHHLQRRGTLPPRRLRRLPSVFAEILNGNYFHYSSGLTSILRDILSR
jgi:glycosyltransferase involved in cell wall biosynthesis